MLVVTDCSTLTGRKCIPNHYVHSLTPLADSLAVIKAPPHGERRQREKMKKRLAASDWHLHRETHKNYSGPTRGQTTRTQTDDSTSKQEKAASCLRLASSPRTTHKLLRMTRTQTVSYLPLNARRKKMGWWKFTYFYTHKTPPKRHGIHNLPFAKCSSWARLSFGTFFGHRKLFLQEDSALEKTEKKLEPTPERLDVQR